MKQRVPVTAHATPAIFFHPEAAGADMKTTANTPKAKPAPRKMNVQNFRMRAYLPRMMPVSRIHSPKEA